VVPLSMDQIRHCCAECHRAEKQPNEPWVRWFQGLTGLKYVQRHRQYIPHRENVGKNPAWCTSRDRSQTCNSDQR
jgi:hypothetical protein